VEEFRGTLAKAGVPAEVVDVLAGFATAIKIGEFVGSRAIWKPCWTAA